MKNRRVVFKKKPIPIPAEYRPMYQIALMSLVLKYCCRGEISKLMKFHLFSWSLYSEENMKLLLAIVEKKFKNPLPHWSIDPALNRALDYAIADGFFERIPPGKYKLLPKGQALVQKIESDDSLFIEEKSFLKKFGKSKLNDVEIERLIARNL